MTMPVQYFWLDDKISAVAETTAI